MEPITDILNPKDIKQALDDIQGGNPFEYKRFFRTTGMSSLSKRQIEKVFHILDREVGHFIDEDDIQDFLKNFGPGARKLTAAETADFMKAGDPNNTGKIGLDDFIAMVESSKHQD
ncbi:parvalbumin beta-like [Ranitomeya variabilis]|uniref:parvalbumin beta-like n=1 Tax=Ranitomeya variabilis TaxID=490064 RepID=UPI0040565EE2